MTSPIAPTPHSPASSHPDEQNPPLPGQLTIFDITPEDTDEAHRQP